MDIRFKISEQEYLDALTERLRQKRKSVVNILVFFMMTVGQVGYFLWYALAQKPEPATAWLLGVLSAGVCAVQLFYQLSVGVRAKSTLTRYKRTGKISESFWNIQHLRLRDDIVSLECGKNKLMYDCAYFIKAETVGGMLVLTFRRGKQVHQLQVPLAAFKSGEEKEAFLDALKASQQTSIRAGLPKAEEICSEGAVYSFSYSMTRRSFEKAFAGCARKLYFTRAGLTLKNIARLAGTVFLIVNAFNTGMGAAFRIFAVLISFLLMAPAIFAFSPLGILTARQAADSVYMGLEKMSFQLVIHNDKLVWRGETFCHQKKLSSVIALEKNEREAYIYFDNGTSVLAEVTDENRMILTKTWLYLDGFSEKHSIASILRS